LFWALGSFIIEISLWVGKFSGKKIQSKLRISQGVDDIFGIVFSIAGHLKKEVSLAKHLKMISVL